MFGYPDETLSLVFDILINYYLFKIAGKSPPLYTSLVLRRDKNAFSFYSPNYAALRPYLLTAVAHIVSGQWF